jgi:mannose-1-phosphate guanylyltransferase
MLHAVVLAGGGGTRLWPASRRRTPKQLLPLGRDPGESLLSATCRRLGQLPGPPTLWVVTAAAQAEGAAAAAPGARVLAEPVARNTAAAIGLAAVHVAAVDGEGVLGIVPADHAIADEPAYLDVVARAFALAARTERIVTVGILPNAPETGFGYLEPGAAAEDGAREVARFVEKPDRATAEGYLARGYLWNAGMFFVGARRILAEIDRHLPTLGAGLAEIGRALAAGEDGAAATARVYPALPSISIDYGVMEKAAGILCLPGAFGWSDVGSWSALADVRPADGGGNVAQGRVLAVAGAGNNIVSCDEGLVALVGVHDLIVVRAGNAVLVAPRARAQEVRAAVAELERAGEEDYL